MQIYDALRNDHRELEDLLDRVMEVDEDDIEARSELIQQTRDVLIPYLRAEECVLYNSLRMIEQARELALRGYIEHMEAEAFLRMLQFQDLANINWRLTAGKLRASIKNHIFNLENQVFLASQSLFTDEEAEVMAEVYEENKRASGRKGLVGTTVEMVNNLLPPTLKDTIRETWNQRPF